MMDAAAAVSPLTIPCRVTDPPLELYTTDKAFRPNPTTVRFGRAVRITPGDTVLDIGTGIGPLAIKAAMDGAEHVYAVDPVEMHCILARRNAAKYGLESKITVFQGGFFDPFEKEPSLRGLRANVIIGDVSGIADGVSHALGWYSDLVPTGGVDGTEQILKLIDRAASRLKPGGTLYFPIAIDLSDGGKILDAAGKRFASVINAFDKPYFEFPLTDPEVEAIQCAYGGTFPPFVNIQHGRRPFWRGQILIATMPR